MELAGTCELQGSKVIELNQRCIAEYVSRTGSSSRTMEICHSLSLTRLLVLRLVTRLQCMEEFLMKILLATATLVALLSSSAHAQYGPWRGYYRAYAQVPPYRAYARVGRYSAYYGAYAQAPYLRTPGFYDLYGRRSPYPYSVYDVRGTYIGSDPDPRIRDQLQRDPGQGRD